INDLLCNAVPDLTLGEPGSPTLPEALRDLRMAGRFDAVADIRGREDGRLGLDLVVTLGGVVARPGRTGQPGPGDLALDDVGGTISLSEYRLIRVDLRGVAGSVAASDEEIVSLSVDAASAEATGAAPEPDPGPRNRSGRLAATVELPEPFDLMNQGALPGHPEVRIEAAAGAFRLRTPIEQAVAPFSPAAAAELRELRATLDPAGV